MSSGHSGNLKWWHIDAVGMCACLSLTIAAYMLIVQPLFRDAKQREALQLDIDAKQDTAAMLANTIRLMQQDLATVHVAIEQNPVQLLTVQHSNQRLADLTHLAAENQLDVHELRMEPTTSAKRFEIIPIHVAGAGTFQTCTAFLHRLRSTFPDTGVTAVLLTDNSANPNAPIGFVLELSWHAAPILSSAN